MKELLATVLTADGTGSAGRCAPIGIRIVPARGDAGARDHSRSGVAEFVAALGLPDEVLAEFRQVVVELPRVADVDASAEFGEREALLGVGERAEDLDPDLVAQHLEGVDRIVR